MKKAVLLATLLLVSSSAVTGFSVVQPLPDGLSDLASNLLGGKDSSDFFRREGDALNGALDMNGNNLLNYFGPFCPAGEAMYGIYDNGTFKCRSMSAAEPLDVTLAAGNDAGNNNINMSGNNITNVDWFDPYRDWKTGASKVTQGVTDPVEVGTYDHSGDNDDQAADVSGGYLYLAEGDLDFKVIDISNKSDLVGVGSADISGFGSRFADAVEVSGGYAYVSNGNLKIIDIGNPSSPTVTGTLSMAYSLDDVSVSGSRAYLANGTSGIHVVDVSNPSSPSVVGTASTPDAHGVDVVGDYAYVADMTDGLKVIDVSNPASPTVVSTESISNARYVEVSGSYAYVSAGTGLEIVNISDRGNPMALGTISTSDTVYRVDVSGDYAYVANDNNGGFKIVDVSDPTSPVIVSDISSNAARDAVVAGGYVYVPDIAWTRALDISDLDLSTTDVGSLRADDVYVDKGAVIDTELIARSGVNVGSRGIKSDGRVAAESLEVTGTKNFVQSVNETHSVVYTSSEAPRPVVEYSTTAQVSREGNFVEFPAHFREVLSPLENYTVLAQPMGGDEVVGVFDRKSSGVLLRASEETTADVHVRGVRKGFEDEEVWRTGGGRQ